MADEWSILDRIPQILLEEHALNVPPADPVVQFHHPGELQSLIDVSLDEEPSATAPTTTTATVDEVDRLCRQVIQVSVKTGHRFFCNQLFGGLDPIGLAGTWVTEALNTSQYTFEVAPVFTLIETAVIERCLKLFGFERGEGIFSPGGSMNNMYALILAKYRLNSDYKTQGLFGSRPLVVFASRDAHYSIMKAAHWIGIGLNNVEGIATNERGQMCPNALDEALDRAKADGRIPFFVNATAGTTVLGAFDDFEKVADVCLKHGVWFHVDACLGGSAALSRAQRGKLLGGIERADSVAWNPHKSLGVPLQCSLLLTRHEGLLHKCNSANAEYLFQQDKFYDTSYDTGDKSIQCGRKVDAFKLWLMLKVRGMSRFGVMMDSLFELRDYFLGRLRQHKNFHLVLPEYQYTNVCFWYIPDRMLAGDRTPEWWEQIYHLTAQLKSQMVLDGLALIGYSPLKSLDIGNFFRMVFTCYPRRTTADLDDLITVFETLGARI